MIKINFTKLASKIAKQAYRVTKFQLTILSTLFVSIILVSIDLALMMFTGKFFIFSEPKAN